MLGDVARVVALHSAGLLAIDEIQHLEKSKSGGSQIMLNFFVNLTNVTKLTPKYLVDDLRLLASNVEEDCYQNFKESGIVLSIMDYLS